MNNLVFGNGGKGIQVYGQPTACIIMNNTSVKNEDGFVFGDDASLGGSFANSVIANNIAYDNNRYGIYECGGCATSATSNNYTNNLSYLNGVRDPNGSNWANIASGHKNDVTGDPQFVNYTGSATGDYHLKSTSPAIDAGTNSGAPSYDLDNGARPQGASTDIGAYEWNATPGLWPMF
jgi:hypothetical protein